MRHEIIDLTPPVERVCGVRLELTLEEYAGLLALHNNHGGGDPAGLRGDIEDGLTDVLDSLNEAAYAKVGEATKYSPGRSSYDRVQAVFRGPA